MKTRAKVSKITSLSYASSLWFSILFERRNIAFMVGVSFICCSKYELPKINCYPCIGKGHNTRCCRGGWSGLLVALMILGPTIWVSILGHEKPITL